MGIQQGVRLGVMRHHYTIQEGSYRLRPVRMEDAAFIVWLRTRPLLSKFIHATSPDMAKQEEWLLEHFERPADYYFLIEHVATNEREGTLGIYHIDAEKRSAEWGRWIVRPGSKAAVPSCLMAFDLAFGELGLLTVHSYVAAENKSVIGLLQALGMKEEARLSGHLSIAGTAHDAVRMRINAIDWKGTR